MPTSRKSAATSSGSAPGLSPACPRGPRPAKSCGCCRPSRRKGRSSTAAPYRRWPTGMWSSMTTTAPSPACFSSSSGPRRWPGATTSSPAPAPCTPTTRSTISSSRPSGWLSSPTTGGTRCSCPACRPSGVPVSWTGKIWRATAPVSASTSGRQQSFWNRPPT